MGVTLFNTFHCLKVTKKHVSKEKAKEIREKAKPIIDWLKTAEEESSGEEEDGNIPLN